MYGKYFIFHLAAFEDLGWFHALIAIKSAETCVRLRVSPRYSDIFLLEIYQDRNHRVDLFLETYDYVSTYNRPPSSYSCQELWVPPSP